MNTIDLKGRTAIVTGAARGIGLATAQKLLTSGAAVALWDVDADALDQAVAGLKQQRPRVRRRRRRDRRGLDRRRASTR